MKRPILVATIGYIIGIIWGQYFKINIALLYFPIIAIYLLKTKMKEFNSLKNICLNKRKASNRETSIIRTRGT